MRFEGLQKVALALSQERSLEVLFKRITNELARYRGVALSRLWIAGSNEQCPYCRERPLTADPCPLHMRASVGHPLQSDQNWNRLDDQFHTGGALAEQIREEGQPILVREVSHDPRMNRMSEWVRDEKIRSFAGHPLIFGGETLGVVAVFTRAPIGERDFEWLRVFAVAMAGAIANARSFDEIDTLRQRLESGYRELHPQAHKTDSTILGSSTAIHRVLEQIELVAPTDVSVLILGETGVGKELVARAIHERSARARHQLVNVNCTAIPDDLFESIFFGHIKGAYSGANTDRMGRFQRADGGSLFLDEVGDLPSHIQPKLLRVVQDGEFEPVGDEQTHHADVRIISASNHDLRSAIAEQRFREDLYYRLSTFEIVVPPLRERKEDIPLLVAHFADRACARLNRAQMRPTPGDLRRLYDYDWPGNVRELQNVVERAVITGRSGALNFELGYNEAQRVAPVKDNADKPSSAAIAILTDAEMRRRERDNTAAALHTSHGRIYGRGGAADLLGLKPTTLNARIKKMGLARW